MTAKHKNWVGSPIFVVLKTYTHRREESSLIDHWCLFQENFVFREQLTSLWEIIWRVTASQNKHSPNTLRRWVSNERKMTHRGKKEELSWNFSWIQYPLFFTKVKLIDLCCIPLWPINIIYSYMLGQKRTRLNYSLGLIRIQRFWRNFLDRRQCHIINWISICSFMYSSFMGWTTNLILFCFFYLQYLLRIEHAKIVVEDPKGIDVTLCMSFKN